MSSLKHSTAIPTLPDEQNFAGGAVRRHAGHPDSDCTQADIRVHWQRHEQGGATAWETRARETKALQPGRDQEANEAPRRGPKETLG
jgi:hypothetical protein